MRDSPVRIGRGGGQRRSLGLRILHALPITCAGGILPPPSCRSQLDRCQDARRLTRSAHDGCGPAQEENAVRRPTVTARPLVGNALPHSSVTSPQLDSAERGAGRARPAAPDGARRETSDLRTGRAFSPIAGSETTSSRGADQLDRDLGVNLDGGSLAREDCFSDRIDWEVSERRVEACDLASVRGSITPIAKRIIDMGSPGLTSIEF